MPNVLELKWGTVKGWDLETPEAKTAMQKWADFGFSASAMSQRDEPGQRDALCEAIDLMDEIWLDWEGKTVTRAEAKEYVRTYRACLLPPNVQVKRAAVGREQRRRR